MAKLTNVRDTVEIANCARTLVLPVKAGTVIYQGAFVAVDDSGMAVPAQKAEGLRAAGRAEKTADNKNGADGDCSVQVKRGVFIWNNTATAADKVSEEHVLGPCYMEDDQTVTANATGASVAGIVIRVGLDGVAVELTPALGVSGTTGADETDSKQEQ